MADEWSRLRQRIGAAVGAVAAFVGLVREVGGDGRTCLELEHYPGMTERSIAGIIAEARQRWRLNAVTVVHRVGLLQPSDQIVLVMTASGHRAEALAACSFIMDHLKTDAVFWKREASGGQARWVQSTLQDAARVAGWRGAAANPQVAPSRLSQEEA